VKSGTFAMTELTDQERHVEYNWWHSGDHIPENMAIEGIVLGTRWAAPQSYIDARVVGDPALAKHQYLGHYLMTDPLEKVWREYWDLYLRTNALGRGYAARVIPYIGHHLLVKTYAAERVPISPEAVPFCPHPGVFLTVLDVDPARERDVARWLDSVAIPDAVHTEGVFGVSLFKRLARMVNGDPTPEPDPIRLMLLHDLDDDPLKVTDRLRDSTPPPELASSITIAVSGPYETIPDPRDYDWRVR
jgi:hypothetical protein